ncbi:hypothetical protein HELRODRAFT_63243 [Helobdella robusta]|uniref:Major facilitator superfamily (MFS) profile domain-containing protein n=1 Tax=Helobdella robusta TaxID=6412 RepID=T1FXC8_HELRO|nr:hypothetical protein HELRODRAFT_63243 [Helobdella robusta]ESO12384.1 hypothetical protein HELRODRAFT_63243 [Helobdella robusta]
MTGVVLESNSASMKPPDGGWGWVVCFASFMIHVLADGISFSFGIFVEEFGEYFECGKGSIGMLGSLMLGVTWSTGPIASILTNKYGCRMVTIVGSIIAFLGFIMSLFASNIYFMFFSFGIVSGIGIGLAYLPAIVAVSFWFEEKRSLATGLAVCGAGVGTFIFAPFTHILITEYGWKGTVLIDSAILLNCVIFGALFRPVKLIPVTTEPTIEEELMDINPTSIVNVISDVKTRSSLLDVSKSESDQQHHRRRVQSESQSNNKTHPVSNVNAIRKDALYNASLLNIPLYRENRKEYTKSMTSVNAPDLETVTENGDCSICSCLSKETRKECKEMLDIKLLYDVSFLLFCISNFLTSVGFGVPLFFLVDRGMDQDWAKDGDQQAHRKQLSLLISIVGILNTVGRIFFGWLADRKFVNRLMLYNTVLVLCGLFTIASSLCTNFALMSLYAGSFGLLIGVYVCLTPVVLVDLLGLEKLSNAFGVVLLFQGIGGVVGPPLAGYIYDRTNNYDHSFYFVGVAILISGLMLYPIPCIRKKWGPKDTAKDITLGKLPTNVTSGNDIVALTKNDQIA